MRFSAYGDVTAWENLLLAYRKAARGKRGKASAAGFEHQLADHLLTLQRDLAHFTYQPGAYVHFTIHDPKTRKISAAPFRDRVVHHALCNVIVPGRSLLPSSTPASRAGSTMCAMPTRGGYGGMCWARACAMRTLTRKF